MPTITSKFKVSQRSQDGLNADALKEAKRRLSGFPPRYRKFQRYYYNNRVSFVKYCFKWDEGEGPNDYQLDILNGLYFTAVRSPVNLSSGGNITSTPLSGDSISRPFHHMAVRLFLNVNSLILNGNLRWIS